MLTLILSWPGSLVGLGLTVVLGWWVAWWVRQPSSPPHHVTHPYTVPSVFYPLKVVIFYCLVKFRKRTAGSVDSAGYGSKSHKNEELMECPQPLHPNPKAIDAVFFSGATKGWGVILAMERRPNRLTSVVVYLKVPSLGVLTLPSHPDTVVFRPQDMEDSFSANGLSITPPTSIHSWKIQYNGRLRLYSDTRDYGMDIKIDLLWSSSLPLFDYDTDMDVMTTAKAFARETWTKEYFQHLREHHQTHYEQMGNLQGSVIVNGDSHDIYLPAFRDHSYGKMRDWKLMHRYVFHHIFLDNGWKGVVGVVCQPSTCSRLMLGNWWMETGDGNPVTDVNLDLKQHGEGGNPPKDYAFTFIAGGLEFVAEVQVEASPEHYLGWNWEARMIETWVNYRVNGIDGSGICEWNYRNFGGRPDELNKKDPDWTSSYRNKYLSI